MLLVVPTSAASSPENLAHALARACDTRTIVDEIRTVVLDRAQQSQDLREENTELQKENEKLNDMHAHGLLDFASDVDPEDFHAFAVVMALGNRNAAAEYLKAGRGTFYDRIARWESLGPSYQRMLRLRSWRKRVGRKIKLTLPDLDAAGSSGLTAANPGVLEEVLASISESESHDYPAVLRDVLRLVLLQGPENWKALRAELLALLRDELPE
jgi:hypothetical protein